MSNDKFIKVIKDRRPKIVVIGGGTGLSVILKGLHEENADVTAIVTVADNGGSSGMIRDYINVVPPGDIRNVIAALSDLPQIYLDVFQYRFNTTDSFFSGHAIGNLIIAALSEMNTDIFTAVQVLTKMMQVRGNVYPVSNKALTLHARFIDGSEISGEHEITAAGKSIEKVWVTETDGKTRPKAVSEAVQAILEADEVILGPGSLFTSILPNLTIDNIAEALSNTSAEIVYICNIMTQFGETESFTDADHVAVLNKHLKKQIIDTVLVNNEPVPESYLDSQKYPEYAKQVKHDFDSLRKAGVNVISDNFLQLKDGGVFHNGDKIKREIINLATESYHRKRLK